MSAARRTFWIIALFAASSAGAQQVPQQLTLEEAQRLALLYNPVYRQLQNNLSVADAGIRQAYGRFLPSLSTRMGFSGSSSSNLNTLDIFGRPQDAPQRVETTSSSASQGISTNVMLFDGGANLRQLSAARANRTNTEARIARDATRLKTEVATNYFNALLAKRRADLEVVLLAAKRDALERTQKLMSVAASKYIDVLSARVDVSTAEQAVEDARSEAEKARLLLKQTLGVEGSSTFELVTEPPQVFDPARLNSDVLVQHALSGSPAVRAAQANLTAADKQASASRGARWPQISGGAGFGRSSSARDFGALGEFNPPNRNLNFSLSVDLPIFRGFQTSLSIANADAAELDAREQLRLERLTVDRDVRVAVIDLQIAYRRVQAAEREATLLRELLAATQEEYRLGTGVTFFQLQGYAERLAQGERTALDARFRFANALVVLEDRINGPVER